MTAVALPLLPKTGTHRVFLSRKGSSGILSGKYVPDNLTELQWQLTLSELTGGVDDTRIHWFNANHAPVDLIKQASKEVYAFCGMPKADIQISIK